MFGLSPMELLIVGIIAVLLFGKKLPDVARSMGKSFTEFKKGMRGIEDDMRQASYSPSPSYEQPKYEMTDDREAATAPKFEPPTSEPSVETAEVPAGARQS